MYVVCFYGLKIVKTNLYEARLAPGFKVQVDQSIICVATTNEVTIFTINVRNYIENIPVDGRVINLKHRDILSTIVRVDNVNCLRKEK